MKIAYLGQVNAPTFTLKAAQQMLPEADLIPIKSIPRVIKSVENGECDGAVIPYENVYNFTVTSTLKQLLRTHLVINKQLQIQVKHCFGYNPDSQNVTCIYSKDQALEQCELWLDERYPDAELISVSSTGEGANIARNTHGAGAIAPIGSMSGLVGVIEDIVPDNYTRFLQLGHSYGVRTGKDSTLSVLDITNKREPGMLERCLGAYRQNGINHSCVQSWPKAGGGYYFIIESDAHAQDEIMQESLDKIRWMGVGVKIVGSYNQ